MLETWLPRDAAGAVAVATVLLAASTAVASALWAVFVRSQENHRAEWKRIEELITIVHNGSAQGLWAQKLAVDELVSIQRRKREVRYILSEASSHFSRVGPSGANLANHIDDALRH